MINFEELEDEKKNGYLRMKELKDSGRPVIGVFCAFTPAELIEASGAVGIPLCGSSEAGIPEAERVLPKTVCPLIKSSYGLASADKCPYFYFSDMILAETTCDGKKKMYELMGELKPTHVMQLPQGLESSQAVDFWENEIYRAKEAIEKTLHVTIEEENIRKAVRQKNRERKATLDFYELGKLKPCPISVKDMLRILDASIYIFDPEKKVEFLEEATRQVKEDYEKNWKGRPSDKPRILITGCPTSGVREKILYQIEEYGGDIVGFENCGGPRCQKDLVDEGIDPMRAMAEKYLRISCSVMSPNPGRFAYMREMAEEYEVDGVVEVILHGCHTFAVEAYKMEQFVTKELHLPYLRIDADFSMSDKGQIGTRIGAFLEMLQ